ncbi:MAG: hypothetical protein F6J97_00895 [Leptolyngbya sp. SIO4C1]|nr:hypothetical protein [Leptolyngbya sp. SIO4C1]
MLVLLHQAMYSVENNLENLELYLEHDSGYADLEFSQEELKEAGQPRLVFNHTEEGVLEGCSYITVDTEYALNLSPGEQRLYEILVALQEGAIYCVTSVGQLAEAMGLENPLAAGKRLENLQYLGAISGFKP